MSQERTTEILDKAQDKFAYFLGVSDNDHKYIHEGKAFSIRGNTGALTAGSGVYYLTFTTPVLGAGRYIHLRPVALFATANIMLTEIHEGSTVGTAGAAAIPQNLNRNSGRKAMTTVTVGSGTVVDGAQIVQYISGAGGGGNATGGGTGTVAERVLKPGTVYTVKISNIGASTASTGYFELFFYEEDAG
jgi:hypothetical protein